MKEQDHIHNWKSLKETRKELRNNLTSAEATLWSMLQKSQLDERKFRRQHSIGPYIVDFYCPKEKLVIELNGKSHFETSGLIYDEQREIYLEGLGYRVMRFENSEIFENPERVLLEIKGHFRGAYQHSEKPPLAPP